MATMTVYHLCRDWTRAPKKAENREIFAVPRYRYSYWPLYSQKLNGQILNTVWVTRHISFDEDSHFFPSASLVHACTEHHDIEQDHGPSPGTRASYSSFRTLTYSVGQSHPDCSWMDSTLLFGPSSWWRTSRGTARWIPALGLCHRCLFRVPWYKSACSSYQAVYSSKGYQWKRSGKERISHGG
jgi:hypothetical protein